MKQVFEHSRGPPIYDGPKAQKIRTEELGLAPYQPVVVDRFGNSIDAATAYLLFRRGEPRPLTSLTVWSNQLADFHYILQEADSGNGLPVGSVNDDVLTRMKQQLTGKRFYNGKPTGCREIQFRTFRDFLTTILQYLLFCERYGWTKGLIGIPTDAKFFRINLLSETPYPRHILGEGRIIRPQIELSEDEAFDAVEVAAEGMMSDPLLIARNRMMFLVKERGLRRQEVAQLPVSAVPTRSRIELARKKAIAKGIMSNIGVTVTSAKTGHNRTVPFPLALAESLRDYADYTRPLGKIAPNQDALFLSSRGKQLNPQSITNLVIAARIEAANVCEDAELKKSILIIGPHRYRHRHITESILDGLEAGMDYTHIMLNVMSDVGISGIETLQIYTHLADRQRKVNLAKAGKVAEIKNDEVLRKLQSWDAHEMFARHREMRKRSRHGA